MAKQAKPSAAPTIELPSTDSPTGPWQVGTAYLVRTVTNYLCGRLVWAGPQELVLEDAAWIADTGRYSDALSSGSLREVEPIPGPVVIGRAAICDAAIWTHPLPLQRK